jgi:hypothetical protein
MAAGVTEFPARGNGATKRDACKHLELIRAARPKIPFAQRRGCGQRENARHAVALILRLAPRLFKHNFKSGTTSREKHRGYYGHGLTTGTPALSKSRVFRVATISP